MLLALCSFRNLAAQEENTDQRFALEQAGDFGQVDNNNIGIVLYYGSENNATPEEAGNWVIDKLNTRLRERQATDPLLLPLGIDALYYVEKLNDGTRGIAVGWHMGGVSVDKREIRAAVEVKVLDEVIDKRSLTANLLQRR